MPTPTIPERDEELEKFIDHTIDCTSFDVDTSAARCGVWGYSNNVVAEMLSKVADFSARRAREKAIEECLAEVPTHTKEQMKEINDGNDDFKRGFYTAFQDIHAYILRLKTK